MRVLLVAHNFLPAHSAGTEVYTAQLARELAARGHEVRVFTTDKDIAQPQLALREREWRGIHVTELVNNLCYASFRETWDHPAIDAAFGAFVERVRPDVVHFQHLLYLSVGCVEQVAQRRIPVVFTLHDYWLHCARFGQRIHADGSLCERIEFARCGACLTSFKFRQTSLERATGSVIAGVRASLGVDLSGVAKSAARALGLSGAQPGAGAPPVDPVAAAALAREVELRDRAMRERVVPRVFRFLSPSRFLRERFVEWGIPAERLQFLRTGIDRERFPSAARRRRAGTGTQRLRVAFIGTLAPHKGAHLLLAAWGRLAPELRARATLAIFGPSQHDPGYQAELARLSTAVGAQLRGALAREAVAAELGELDLLVVPSVWYENSPLVILEALALRTPVLVSALGGMAELVEPGVSGAHFAVGDVGALERALDELLREPARLAALYAHDATIQDVAQDALQIEGVYREALDAARAESERGR